MESTKSVAELMADADHDSDAQYQIGMHYLAGTGGVERDEHEAMKWLRKAAENGNVDAQYRLHLIYLDKSIAEYMAGADYDDVLHEVMKWGHKAAENGNMGAQCSLHLAYGLGIGVPMDAVKSLEWATRAAEQGSDAAKYFMHLYYSKGPGAPKGGTESMVWCVLTAATTHTIMGLQKAREMQLNHEYNMAIAYKQLEEMKMLMNEFRDELSEFLAHS